MRALILAIALFLVSPLCAWGAEVLVLQSTRDASYSEAVRGFRAGYPGSTRTVVLRDYAEVDVVRLVREERAHLVLAVGDAALNASRKIREIPVLAVLAPSINYFKLATNLTGINVVAPPDHYLRLCRSMGKKRIGLLFDPKKSGQYVHQALRVSREQGVSLELVEVHNSLEIQAALERLKGKMDVAWILPDSTVVSAMNVEALLMFSMANKVPVLSYVKQHLSSGAAVSLDIDHYDVGRQAGELAPQLQENGNRGKGILFPRKVQLNTNGNVLRRLGVTLEEQ